MPNYIKNRLEIFGTEKQISEIIKRFSTHFKRTPRKSLDDDLIYRNEKSNLVGWLNEKTGEFKQRDKKTVKKVPDGFEKQFDEAWTRFPDFNKIIEMPEALNITSDSWVAPLENQFSAHEKFKEHLDKMREIFNKSPGRKEETMSNFLQGVENYLNYGHATWYNWSVANWGVKWNSSECENQGNIFTFDTAWSGVPALIDLISKGFPKIRFVYEWSDEDTGCNCGIGTYLNGELGLNKLENGSIEAFELAFKLRPSYKEDYKLVGNTYEYSEEN